VARASRRRDSGGPTPTGVAVTTGREDVRGVWQVEGAKVLGDLGARLVILHLKAGPDPTLAVPAVGAASAEALTEGLRVGKLIRRV